MDTDSHGFNIWILDKLSTAPELFLRYWTFVIRYSTFFHHSLFLFYHFTIYNLHYLKILLHNMSVKC